MMMKKKIIFGSKESKFSLISISFLCFLLLLLCLLLNFCSLTESFNIDDCTTHGSFNGSFDSLEYSSVYEDSNSKVIRYFGKENSDETEPELGLQFHFGVKLTSDVLVHLSPFNLSEYHESILDPSFKKSEKSLNPMIAAALKNIYRRRCKLCKEWPKFFNCFFYEETASEIICHDFMILQIKIHPNKNKNIGYITLNALMKRVRLEPKPINSFNYFYKVENSTESIKLFTAKKENDETVLFAFEIPPKAVLAATDPEFADSIEGEDSYVKFWINWMPNTVNSPTPILSIGLYDSKEPIGVFDLKDLVFDYKYDAGVGWEINHYLNVLHLGRKFIPHFYSLDGPSVISKPIDYLLSCQVYEDQLDVTLSTLQYNIAGFLLIQIVVFFFAIILLVNEAWSD